MEERLLSVKEEIEKYGPNSVATVELVSELVEVDLKVITELVEEFGTIQKACENATYSKCKINPKETYKLNLLGELLKRNTFLPDKEKPKINSPEIVAELYMQEFRHLEVEYFDILILNTKNQIIKKVNITKGTLNQSIVHPREVFKEAFKYNANSIILLHNHPSGDVTPSDLDIEVTKRLVEVAEIMGIKILDHIIFGDNKYLSMKEEYLL